MYYTWPFFLNFYEFPFLTVISDHERIEMNEAP